MEDKDKEHLNEVFKKAVSYINKAASKGVIHKNNAARKVSRLSKRVHSALQAKG
jgi:small subunit ribosomal protein S20